MTTASRILVSLAPLALVLACGTDADRKITGSLSANHAANFSAWSEPVNLGPTINTSPYNDQQAALSKDGLSLYFASTRPGTPGSTLADIWVAHRACLDCPWESPVNLGAPVNTAVSEAAPALSRDEHWPFVLATNPPGGIGSGV